MKNIIMLFLLSVFFVGCSENLNQPQDSSYFEKRTPVTNTDSLKGRFPIQRALECLNLTREQRITIDSILMKQRLCSVDCKKTLNESIKTLRKQYQSNMEKYRGVKRTDVIKKEIETLTLAFHQSQKDLQKQYKECTEVCETESYSSIETVLTTDQIVQWTLWKINGKIPCDNVRP